MKLSCLFVVLMGCATAPPQERPPAVSASASTPPQSSSRTSYLAWKDGVFVPVAPLSSERVRDVGSEEEWVAHALKVTPADELEPGMAVYFPLPGAALRFRLGTVGDVRADVIQVNGAGIQRSRLLVDDCAGGMVGGADGSRFSVCP